MGNRQLYDVKNIEGFSRRGRTLRGLVDGKRQLYDVKNIEGFSRRGRTLRGLVDGEETVVG